MRKKVRKIIIGIVSAVLAVVVVLVGGFGIRYAIKANRSTETIGKTATEYTMDESGSRIANIPFSDYITVPAAPENAVTPDIRPDATGEENSAAIQTVVDTLSENGGGTVYIPEGEYKVSTIFLKSNITFFISNGAKLVSLSYAENIASASPLNTAVLFCNEAENVTITGGGTVNGCGVSYTNEPETEEPMYALTEFNLYTRVNEARKRIRTGKDTARNNILQINASSNVTVENIVLEESAGWTFVITESDNVTVDHIVIDNNVHVANTDGIDICSGSDTIRISSCFISTGDDAVVLKPSDNPIRNVTVENCEISSFANCFKIGTETQYDVTDVTVQNCKFFMPDGIVGGYAGIAIESADGSHISRVTVDNITMDGISAPLLIWLGDRLRYETTQEVGSISDISISNITATNTEMPSAITGCTHDGVVYDVQNVTLTNIQATYRDTGENLSVLNHVPEFSMRDYPEITRVSHIYFISHKLSEYWDLPCYGLFVRHTSGVDYSGYSATPRTCNEREMYYLDDVK